MEYVGSGNTPSYSRFRERRSAFSKDSHTAIGKRRGIITALATIVFIALLTLVYFNQPIPLLYVEGKQNLESQKYAFAREPLEKLTLQNRNDAKAFMALARAYIGTDEPVRAWQAIARAKQLGAKLTDMPELVYGLANFYTTRRNYKFAADLLQPLASKGNAKAEAQLTAVYTLLGEQLFAKGRVANARLAWHQADQMRNPEQDRYQNSTD